MGRFTWSGLTLTNTEGDELREFVVHWSARVYGEEPVQASSVSEAKEKALNEVFVPVDMANFDQLTDDHVEEL